MPKQNQLPENYEEQVKQLTAMAMGIIHDENNQIEARQLPDAYQAASQAVQHPDDAGPKAVADVSLWVLEQVEKEAARRGKQILPAVVLGAIGTISTQVAEVAVMAGICQLNEEDIQIAISTAINQYAVQAKKEGRVTDQQLMEVARAFQSEFPDEAEKFQQTVAVRQQRQAGQGQPAQAPTPEQQPVQSQPVGEGLIRRPQ